MNGTNILMTLLLAQSSNNHWQETEHCIFLRQMLQWDEKNRFDFIFSDFLAHVTDEKPITARQCIKALAQVGAAKPQYIPRILYCLQDADVSKYKDSMRP